MPVYLEEMVKDWDQLSYFSGHYSLANMCRDWYKNMSHHLKRKKNDTFVLVTEHRREINY
jgi:hypothetical protein